MRHKGIHVVNVPLSLKRLSNIILSFLSHKLRSRIRIYSNFDQFTAIDKDNLPKEYGGKVPIKEMAALWKQEMLLYHKLRLDYVNMKIRTDMYPSKVLEGCVTALRIPLNKLENTQVKPKAKSTNVMTCKQM